MIKRAGREGSIVSWWRIAAASAEVELAGFDGQRLPFPDSSAPDNSVARRHRFDPTQQRMAAGCHLDRDISALLEAGGMHVTRLECYYAKGEPKVVGSLYEGAAVAAL